MNEQRQGQNLKIYKPSGLQTAWLLATLGSKLNTKKTIRKEILQVSIPDICSELIEIGNERNIRYSSNILYGISLMYTSKINYFLNDISLVQTRLKRDFCLRKIGNYNDESGGNMINITSSIDDDSKSGQMFLNNDPSFNIDIDLVPFFDFEESDSAKNKRRKLEIKYYDLQVFPDFPNSSDVTGTHPDSQHSYSGILFQDDHDKTIENFMEMGIGNFDDILEDNIEETKGKPVSKKRRNETIDFEFNDNGEIVNFDKSREQEVAIDEFDLGVFEIAKEFDEDINKISGKTIADDENFHLSTTDNQVGDTHQLVLGKSKLARQTSNFSKLILDEGTRISSKDLSRTVNSYEDRMISISNEEKTLKRDDLLLANVLNELQSGLPTFANYASKLIFGEAWNSGASMTYKNSSNKSFALSSILRELESVTRIHNNIDEFEIGREVQRSDFLNDDFANNDFEIINQNNSDENHELEEFQLNQPQQDIFELSFDGLGNEIRSRFNSRGSARSSSNRRDYLEEEHHEDFFQEESINFTPGAPILRTQIAKLNSQLLKFLQFLRLRNDVIGERFNSSQIKLNKVSEDSQLSTLSPSTATAFSRVSFAKLIPNLHSCQAINEVPINRKLAANSFSSILALATRNLVKLDVDRRGHYDLLRGDSIQITIDVQ